MNYLLPKKNTQKAYILYQLLIGKLFKNADMWQQLNTGYSASRISELRSDGWRINAYNALHHSGNPNDRKVKRYYIAMSDIAAYMECKDVQDFIQDMSKISKKIA